MAEEKKTITSMMDETRKFPPSKEFSESAHIKSLAEYQKLYKRSIEDPDGFWGEQAQNLEWFKKWDKVLDYSFGDNLYIKWFKGGKINLTVNCLDRHLKNGRRNKAALIWEGEPGDSRTYTYQQLYNEVCKFANVLKKKGLKKGDRVTIYMPMIPELPIAMLACARIGAIHSIVFGGFSADALKDRILDSQLHDADHHGCQLPQRQGDRIEDQCRRRLGKLPGAWKRSSCTTAPTPRWT